MNYKKGAMFGLDARIALAIFGALSVISGAALYSAIQGAKATAILTDMKEFGKAWEQYYLDTGEIVSKNSSDSTSINFYRAITKDFVEDPGVAGWKGPYLSYEVDGYGLKYPGGIHWHILTLTKDATWSSSTWNAAICTAGKKCDIWIYLNGMESDERAIAIDKIVDDGDGALVGNFRWYNTADPLWKYSYLLMYAPVDNPHD